MKKVLGVKVKKEDMPKGNVVPMHPELSYSGSLSENSWEASDMETGGKVKVFKKEKGEFVEYEIEGLV